MKNYLLFMRVIFLLIAEIGNWKTKTFYDKIMEINWNKDPCKESLPFTEFERSNSYKQFIQALYQFENIIIRIKTCRMNDHERHYLFCLAHRKLGTMISNCRPALQKFRIALKEEYKVNIYRGTLVGPLRMTKEEVLLKVMSMLKNNQVGFLMELSEIKNNSLYQAIVDVLEYYSPFVQKLFHDWRRYHRMHPRPNRLPIPYTTDS